MELTPTTNGTHSLRSTEKCYETMRRMLICGQIPPGTRLREVEWSERFGIQRAALREALVLLVHDGLLRRRPTGGFFTPRLDEINVNEIIDTRIVLELGGVKLTCARNLPSSAFAAVVEVCDVLERCHEAGMVSAFAEADFMFHQKLLEMSGNAPLIQTFSRSAQLIFLASPVTEEARRAAETKTIHDHREILACVQKRNVAQATALLESHLVQAKTGFQSALR